MPARRWRRPVAGLAVAALLLAGGVFLYRRASRRAALASDRAAYVDSAACAGCHADIAKTHRETGMGRSLYRPRPENTIEDYSGRNTFYHRPSERHYTMTRRDGKFYQRRHQIGPDGREINVVEKEIHYAIGSGNHARSYLHQTPEGKLAQLPVAWYAAGYWAMNPGYDRPDHKDFRRHVTFDCLFCHNAYPAREPESDSSGMEPVFRESLPEGIDCQRCHGPGSEHLRAAAQPRASPERIRGAILNPARLSPDRQLEVCMQCHLETTSRRLPYSIRRYDRGPFSYRPGEPLAAFILHFDHPAGAGYDDKFEIAHQAYRLRRSACFQKSGVMTCTTCHQPHQAARGEAAVARYLTVCRSCHAQPHTTSNCLPCHMPRRRTDDVVHVVMTDHFIQRRKPARDLLAPLPEIHESQQNAYRGEVALYYPPRGEELYLAAAQVVEDSNLTRGIARLEEAIAKHRPEGAEFHFELAEAYWKAGQAERALRHYEEAARRAPNLLPALRNYSIALSRSGRLPEAEQMLVRALHIAPRDASLLNNLGEVYLQQGKPDRATEPLRKALAANPELPEAANNLAEALSQTGDGAAAEASFRHAIRLQPDFAVAHNNLANLLTRAGDFPQARHHFEQAIRSDPKYAATRYNYGVALAEKRLFAEARRHLEAAIRLDPTLAEAHNNLGNLHAMKGDAAGAARSYRHALALKPGLFDAHLNLGNLLFAQGDQGQAEAHFRKAAESPDPALRQSALTALNKMLH